MKNQDEFKDALLQKARQRTAQKRRRGKLLTVCVSLALCLAILASFILRPTTVQAADLMAGIRGSAVSGKAPDDAFAAAQMAFAVKLFQACAAETGKENTLVSPLSVMVALAMTANGADGQTRQEMEAVLGMPADRLNAYLYGYVNQLSSSDKAKLSLANSIWFRDTESLQVKRDFLQTNADYYKAAAYAAPFDEQTVRDINTWTKKNTDGMIDKIVEQIDPLTMLYLINALVFDAKWERPYKDDTEVRSGSFTADDGTRQTATMLYGIENGYLSDANATGFVKDYAGGSYRFVALLPNEGMDIRDYVASLTPEGLKATLDSMKKASVHTAMPCFEYDYSLKLNDVLSDMGMPAAFSSSDADFVPMATSDLGNIYIGKVLHKTHITLDTEGTRAAAVTKVEMNAEGAVMADYFVILNRPFVYLIIDTATNLPIFMGTVLSVEN